MRMVIPVSLMASRPPPVPYLIWGPQAVVRYANMRGFDFSRPYRGGWDNPENPTYWFWEHSFMADGIQPPGPLFDPENRERERTAMAEQWRRRRPRMPSERAEREPQKPEILRI